MKSDEVKGVPVSYQKFLRACDELVKEGKRPTASLVMEKVKSGSMATCNDAIKFWWANLADRIGYYEQYPDLDHEVVDLAAQLMEKANERGEAKWAGREKELTHEVSELERTLDEVVEALKEAAAEKETLKSELEQVRDAGLRESEKLTDTIKKREQSLEKLEKAFSELESRLGQCNSDLAVENDGRRKAEGRCADLLQEIQAKADLLSQMREEKSAISAEREAALRQLEKLEGVLSSKDSALAKEQSLAADLREQLGQATSTITMTEKEVGRLKDQVAKAEKESDRVQAALEAAQQEKRDQADEYKVRIEELQSRVAEQSATIESLIAGAKVKAEGKSK